VRLRDVLLDNGFRADGGGPSGAVSLLSARIGGLLDLLGGPVLLTVWAGPFPL